MDNVLVVYFSASGVTRKVADRLARTIRADQYEIEPVNKYTGVDLDWHDKRSRTTIEMEDKTTRPEMKEKHIGLEKYDTIILGFPVWWYTAPRIINTFIESNNLEGKKVYVFVTSGGSGSEGSFKDLKETYPNINFISSRRLRGTETEDDYKEWIK